MIIATETPDRRFAVETTVPVGGRIQKFTAASEAEAVRLANVWTKLYIIEYLSKWLLQRAFAFQLTGMVKSCDRANDLLRTIYLCQHYSLTNLMKWVASHREDFHYLAPGEKSAHYKFYHNTIVEILDYCQGKELVS